MAITLWSALPTPASALLRSTSVSSVSARRDQFSSSLDRDAVDLEMCPAQQRAGTDEGACRVVLAEIALVHVIEFRIQRHVRAEDLDEDKVVHGHASFGENRLHAIENNVSFLLHIRGRLAGLRIKAESARDVERVPHQHAIAEGSLDRLGQIDVAPPGLRTILWDRLCRHGNCSRDDHHNQQTILFHWVLLNNGYLGGSL